MSRGKNNQIIAIDEHRHTDIAHQYDNNLTIDTSYSEENYNDEIDLKQILSVLLRHKKAIILSTVLLALASWLFSLSIVPVYRATTTLKIDTEADKLAQYEGAFEEKNTDRRTFHKTQTQLLASRKLAKRVITKLEVEKNTIPDFQHQNKELAKRSWVASTLSSIRKLITGFSQSISSYFTEGKSSELAQKAGNEPDEIQFLKHLTVTPEKNSNLVKVHFDSIDPQFAAIAANTLANEFITMNLEDILASSKYAKSYLTEQIALTKQRLEASEKRLVDFAKEKKIINADTSKSLVSEALDSLNQAYTTAQQELIVAESNYRQRNLVSGDLNTQDNAVIQTLKQQLSQLSTKYRKDLQTYKPAFPAMIALKKQINETQRQIKLETQKIRKNAQNDYKSRYLAAKEKVEMLSKKLEAKKAELLTQRDKSIGYTILQREVETNRQLYNNLLQRMKEVGIAGGVVSNNISVVDEAYVPSKSYKPNTPRNTLIGTLLGLMLGVAYAFLRENVDDTFKTVHELKNFSNLPVLGVFPFEKNKKKDLIVLEGEEFSVANEAFRSLLTNLEYVDTNGLPKILHITSSSPGEGKSNTAIHMALTLADSKGKTLLIDADLRKPKVDTYLSVKSTKGLADYLVSKKEIEDVIVKTETENLSIITAGTSAPSPAKLLADSRLLELLEYASHEFEHIIIDSPPLLGLADALILANRADATLFAVACGETKREHLTDALERLKMGYGNVVGFIFTKAKSSKNDYYSYDNYYGHNYRASTADEKILKLKFGT